MERFPEIGATLRVEPELGSISEDAPEDEGGIRSHRSAIPAEFVDMLARQSGPLRQIRLTDTERLHKLFCEYFSGGGGFSF